MSATTSSSVSINALLKKTEHYDKDERYMATSDLCEVLKRHASGGSTSYDGYGKMDASTERRICTAVLRLLHDKSNDVQAIAVKTLGVLLTTVHEEQVLEIADSLADQVLDAAKSELRDVYAIGLRTLCKTVPPQMGDKVSQRLGGRLLDGIRTAASEEIVLACLDILTDMLSRFGATALSLTRQHEQILQICLNLLCNDAHVIRKRTGNTIGTLSVVLSDALLVRMVESLLSQIEMADGVGKRRKTRTQQSRKEDSKIGDTRALIRTMCTVSGAVGHRLGQTQIDRIIPIFLKFCEPDDAVTGDDDMMDEVDEETEEEGNEDATALANELRESCFNGFESFVLRCPTEVEPHLEKIIQAAMAYMSYDPNYSYGDEPDDQEENDECDDDADDHDDLDDDEDDDDDDDDDSWKVRRAAIRAMAAVVKCKQHNPVMLWTKDFDIRRGRSTTMANAMVGRFKEREENCRVDVIDCFTKLLSVTIAAASSGVVSFGIESEMDITDSGVAIDLSSKYGPTVVKACEKLFAVRKGGERSKSSALSLLSTLCRAPGGVGGEVEVNSVFKHVKSFLLQGRSVGESGLSKDVSNKTLKLDALCLIRVMLSSGKHAPSHIKNALCNTLLADICLAVQEQWYKVIAEALRVLTEVPGFFPSGFTIEDPDTRKKEMDSVAAQLFTSIEPLLSASDVDQEIKECALTASASLLASLHGSLTPDQIKRILSLLLEKLKNETTRIAAIKTISSISAASNSESMDEEKIDLSCILCDVISSMGTFLRQQSRRLKQSALEALVVVVSNHGSTAVAIAGHQMFSSVQEELATLIVDSDLHLSHLSMRVSIAILRVCPDSGPAVKSHILPPVLALTTSPLMQDVALESLLSFFEQLVVSNAVEFAELLCMLHGRASNGINLSKFSISHLAKCIAVITAATSAKNRQGVITELLAALDDVNASVDSGGTKLVVLSLLVSGDLGQGVDFSSMAGVADRLQAIYMECFDSSSEEVKQAAAYALGRATIGAQGVLLPALLSALDSNEPKKQYLLLAAVKEFIQCQQKSLRSEKLAVCVPVIMHHLLQHCSDFDEGSRTVVAECMGSLACIQPVPMFEKLQALCAQHFAIVAPAGHVSAGDEASEKNALVCWTVVTSVKHAIAGKVSVLDLSTFMPDFLKQLEQEEITVRNAALLMVYSAVHHMPQLVASFMNDLIVPSLFAAAELKLTRVVDLGPFKHTVDDALPLRKSAMSIFATCLEKLPATLDIANFMPVLCNALGDLEDVQLKAHQIVISMCNRHPTYLVAFAETFVGPFEEMFSDKMIKRKIANKTGTELERAKEWIKSGLRALMQMSKLDGAMNCLKFATFVERVKANPKLHPMLDILEDER